jgi:hypothetical protein
MLEEEMSERAGRELLGRCDVEGVFGELIYDNENGIIGFIGLGVDRGGQPSNEVYGNDLPGSLRYRERSEFTVGAVIPRFCLAVYGVFINMLFDIYPDIVLVVVPC